MIYDYTGVKIKGDLIDGEVSLGGSIISNNIPILERNFVDKMNLNNGYSKGKMFRKIASIPIVAMLKAAQDGYNLDDPKDLHKFLNENPDYMTVEKLVNPHANPLNIIK